MSWQKEAYWHLPVALQNACVSTVGVRRRWHRFGGRFQEFLNRAMEMQSWSADRLADFQIKQLRELVDTAMRHVPHYRESYSQLGIDPLKLDDIRQLPLLEKETYRQFPERFVSDRWPRRQLMEFHTSGSSGTPLTWFAQRDDFRQRIAFIYRQFVWAGAGVHDRVATFTGNLIVGHDQNRPPFWRHNWTSNQLLFSAYHLAEKNLPAYANALQRFEPQVIEGYPSAVYILARHLEESGLDLRLKDLKAILLTAETLHEFQRAKIENVFGVRVSNYYGSSEAAPMITQCAHGGLHANLDSGIFEFLRPDGTPAAAGEMGEMVVTTFASRAMPLIRYRILDLAIPEEPGPCACGCNMPRVREIVGRMDDMVYTRERGWVGRLSQVMKVFPGSIREAQIIQETIDDFVVKLVPDPAKFSRDQIPAMLADMKNRLGEGIHIKVELAEHISKGSRSKFKYVVCNLPEEQKRLLWSNPSKVQVEVGHSDLPA